MSTERPLEMSILPVRLHSDFDMHLPAAVGGSEDQREKNFLSRALAAFAIQKLSGCTVEEAAQAIVDGGGDGGIDAIRYSPLSNTLWIVQSKYMDRGVGEPALGDVGKFKNGIEDLLQGRFDSFRNNSRWGLLLPQVESWLRTSTLRVRAILVYSGINLVSEDRLRMFEDVKHRFSPNDDYFAFTSYNLTTIGDWLTGADEGVGVSEVELTIHYPGWVNAPYETVYGLVKLADAIALYGTHGKQLIAANIRHYVGATEVNARIVTTLTDEPEHFFYLNNGLTAYCERLEMNNFDRANTQYKRLKARSFSIINGAQTLGSLAEFCRFNPSVPPDGFVFLKLVSLERCMNDLEFAQRITQSTNFQNQIGARDFVSLDEQQERIALQLRQFDIEYHYKSDADTPDPDDANMTLLEATIALACLEQEADCDLCSRVLANRNSLWSFKQVYPESELHRTRYHHLFRPERSARTVWRAVQAYRSVVQKLQSEAQSSVGIRQAFFDNARWLVLNLVYLRLHPERGEEMALTEAEAIQIVAATLEIAETLWSACESLGYVSRRRDTIGGDTYEQPMHFRSVFCSAVDCARLRKATLTRLSN